MICDPPLPADAFERMGSTACPRRVQVEPRVVANNAANRLHETLDALSKEEEEHCVAKRELQSTEGALLEMAKYSNEELN